MYCPKCGARLTRLDRGNPVDEYKGLYQQWQKDKVGPPPPLPDESLHFICPAHCFGERHPLIMHLASGRNFLPKEDSWSLTFKGPARSLPGV